MIENQFIYPYPKGSKLIFFAPPGVGVNEENQSDYYFLTFILNSVSYV